MASQPSLDPENGQHFYRKLDPHNLPMRSLPDYTYEWQDYGRRRVLALALLFLWAPVTVAAFIVSRYRYHVPLQMVGLILFWGLATVGAIMWAGDFRCPRCRRRVGSLGRDHGPRVLWRGLFDKVCPNCHLHRFAQE